MEIRGLNLAKQKPITLEAWIADKGVTHVAEILGVNPSAVRHWRLGNCRPNVTQMRAIKRATKGAISYDEMIDGPTNSNVGTR